MSTLIRKRLLADENEEIIENLRMKILDGEIEKRTLDKDLNNIINIEIKKSLPTDKITCEICGGKFTRNNRTLHKGTKYHQQGIIEHNKFLESLNN
jgi:hypothetical protein